jgi:hypothetical protein
LENSKRGDCSIDLTAELSLKVSMLDYMIAGWLDDEIFKMIRNTEYFDNVTDEMICLNRMRQTRADVEERLHLVNLHLGIRSK